MSFAAGFGIRDKSATLHDVADAIDDLAIPHHCVAWRNTFQAIPSSVNTKIQLNSTYIDPFGLFDGANGRITISRSGAYHIAYNCGLDDNVNGMVFQLTLMRNGSGVHIASVSLARTMDANVGSSVILSLQAGDYLEIYLFHTAGSPQNTFGAAIYRPRINLLQVSQ